MLRRRTHFIWSSFVIATCAASSILVYISLAYSGNYCKFGNVCSKEFSEIAEKLEEEECIKSCSTESCILHANILHENINPAVSPCEDFYSFSCGSFAQMFPKDSDSSSFGAYTLKLKLELKDLLDNLEEDLDTSSGKMKIAYDSCMDVESSELQALSTAREFLQNLGIPNWPYLEPDFQFTKPNLPIALGISIAYKEYGFIKITNRIVRGKPVFNATIESHASYLETNRGPTYDKAIGRILRYFGLGKEAIDQIKSDIQPINASLNLVSVRERSKLCGRGKPKDYFINCTEVLESEWVTVCRILKAFVDVANITEQISTEIIVVSCMQAAYVNRVFTKISNMTHRSIANYLAMNFFLEHLDDLSFYFRLIKQEVRNPREVLEDKIFPLNHWEHCVEWIVRNMHIALGYEYILKFLPKSALLEVNNIIKEVFQQARSIVFQQNWLTDEEKIYITNRFNITTSTALQMQTYMNETFVNDSYQKFYPVRESFLNTVLEHQRAYFSTYLVRERKHRLLSDLRPFTMNAYSDTDIIEIGFGNLKFPFYLHSQSRSLNTVFLAMTVGHEIGHAITEALGIEFLKNKHRSARVNYDTRLVCFEKQYSNFTIESLGVKINWEKTKDEILSDSMSIILTDLFIKKYITSEDMYVLPTLSYAVKELMYIIYSQFWCAKSSRGRDEENFKSNPHPPENFRVIAVMQNSKLFSEVFHCQKEDYMNSEQKCLLMDEEET